MDLDAEMAALQAEARAKLEAKAQEERALAPDPSLGPDPSLEAPPEGAEVRTFPGLPDLSLPEISGAKAIAAGLETVGKTQEAAKTAAKSASRFSLLQKVGIGVVSLVVFVVCWKLFLKTIVEAVLGLAILLLILVAIGKLLGWTDALRRKKDED